MSVNTPTPTLNPEFKHRLSSPDGAAKLHLLTDGVDALAFNALHVLHLVNMHFTGADQDRPTDEVIYWSIDSAIKSIQDIQCLVEAYYEAIDKPHATDAELAAAVKAQAKGGDL